MFKSDTNDLQDLFKEILKLLKTPNCPKELFTKKEVVREFMGFLYKKARSKSTTKTILKVFFILFKKTYTQGLITFKKGCLLEKVVEDIEKKVPQPDNSKKKFSVFNSMLFPGGHEELAKL